MDDTPFLSAKAHMSTAGPQIQEALLDKRPSNMSSQTMMRCISASEFLREINL